MGSCVVGLWHVNVSAHRGGGAAQTLHMCICDWPSANSQISFKLLGPFQWFLAFLQVYKTRQVIKYKKDDKLYNLLIKLK